MFSSAGKTLLKNVIRHTDTHNRMVEEADMWRMKSKLSSNEDNYGEHDDRRVPSEKGSNSSHQRAHMDDIEKKSTHWLRKLEKAESEMTDRWGHGGYKELYPEDFDSDRSEDEESSSKRKKKQKHRKSKKRKKHKDDSDTSSDTSKTPPRKSEKQHRKKSKHKLSSKRKTSKHKKKTDR